MFFNNTESGSPVCGGNVFNSLCTESFLQSESRLWSYGWQPDIMAAMERLARQSGQALLRRWAGRKRLTVYFHTGNRWKTYCRRGIILNYHNQLGAGKIILIITVLPRFRLSQGKRLIPWKAACSKIVITGTISPLKLNIRTYFIYVVCESEKPYWHDSRLCITKISLFVAPIIGVRKYQHSVFLLLFGFIMNFCLWTKRADSGDKVS